MPFPSNAENRDLQYPLNRSLVAELQTGAEELTLTQFEWATTDPDERVVIALELSLNEFIGLSSSIDVGSDIAFGEDAILIWWTWVRSFTSVDFCSKVAECVLNDPTVQAAISTAFSGNGGAGGVGTPNAPLPQSLREENLFPSDLVCDNGHIFNQCLEVVQALDRAAVDFFQIVEAITNPAEYAVLLADNWGAAGAIPASVAETAAWLQDTIAETYNAAYTASVESELACALFCVAEPTCSLSLDDIYNAYQEESTIDLPDLNDIASVFDFLFTVTLNTDKLIVASVHLMILAMLRWGSSFANIGTWSYLKIVLESAKSGTNTGWTACSCASLLCWEYDFTAGVQHGFVFVGNSDTWALAKRPASGQPVAGTNTGSLLNAGDYQDTTGTQVRSLLVYKQFSADVDIREVQADVSYARGNGSGTDFQQHIYSLTSAPAQDGDLLLQTGSGTSEGTDITISNEVTKDGSRGMLVWLKSDDGAPQAGTAQLLRLRIITTATSNQPDDSTAC